MGHKVHPVGFRIGVIRDWDAKWYADRHYKEYLQEDLRLRKVVSTMYPEAGVSTVEIDRQSNNVYLTIHTARPGILIGRGGQRVDELRAQLEKLIGKRIQLNIREVPQPELDAYLVARNVADQLERRIAYRRTLKQSLLRTMQAGARGMRISCGGRLDGAEIARRITMHEGQVPLHTLRADIDYGFAEARTTMGRIGVKVWIYRGDILPEAVETEEAIEPVIVADEETLSVETAVETAEPVAEETVGAAEAAEPVVEVEPALVDEAEAAMTTGEASISVEASEVEATVEPVAVEETATGEEKPVKAARRRTTKKAEADAATEAATAVEEAGVSDEASEIEAVVETVAVDEPVTAEAKPVKTTRRRTTRKAETEAEVEPVAETTEEPVAEEEKPKTTRRRTTKKAEADTADETEAKPETDKPVTRRRTRAAATTADEQPEAAGETEEITGTESTVPTEDQGEADASA